MRRGPRLPPTLRWSGDAVRGRLELLDQTLLPHRIRVLRCRTTEELVGAIRRLAVRGAPALGVAGAYGVVLALVARERYGVGEYRGNRWHRWSNGGCRSARRWRNRGARRSSRPECQAVA